MRHITKQAFNAIKKWEGFQQEAYRDAAGIWTIGYGHSVFAGPPIPCKGMKIKKTQAEKLLLKDLAPFENAVETEVKVALNDNQFSALVSFTYNVGIEAFCSSTLLRKLNTGHYSEVPTELMKWTKINGKKYQGLVHRRSAEIALWNENAIVPPA